MIANPAGEYELRIIDMEAEIEGVDSLVDLTIVKNTAAKFVWSCDFTACHRASNGLFLNLQVLILTPGTLANINFH